MKGINIDESNKLIINPMQIDSSKFTFTKAETQAPNLQDFSYVEPVEFGTGCFGNPEAFNRLQEIIHQRENSAQDAQEDLMPKEAVVEETSDSLETNFAPIQEVDNGPEPAFC